MMRTGLRMLGVHSENAVMVGSTWIQILLPALGPGWTPCWYCPACLLNNIPIVRGSFWTAWGKSPEIDRIDSVRLEMSCLPDGIGPCPFLIFRFIGKKRFAECIDFFQIICYPE